MGCFFDAYPQWYSREKKWAKWGYSMIALAEMGSMIHTRTYGGWLRNPASVGRWFFPMTISLFTVFHRYLS
jgi:hypothetical protein